MNLEAYLKIKEEIGSKACLIAVSKGQPIQKILGLYNEGHRNFGENFLQELSEKKAQLPDDIKWHFLGNIQSNKLPEIVKASHIIHSVSRHKIYKLLVSGVSEVSVNILLQLKLGSEQTKSGFSEDEILDIVEKHDKQSKIKIKGIMVISENNIDSSEIKLQFQQARRLFEKTKKINDEIEIISMGMSSDYHEALSCNSNMVRLGTVIFGERE
tara:strand:+ start:942 stop:1580 length:639 start_codon:yes stop_codon:yes gene_type:complete